MISPLAYIHPEAKIGENVEIAPFVFIDKNVVIGDNNKIMANANICYLFICCFNSFSSLRSWRISFNISGRLR